MSEVGKDPETGKGYIYILSNPSMPNIYKVGLTTNSVKQRIQELNTTGIPKSFELVKKYEIRADKLQSVERLAHRKLKSNKFHHGKEFFKASIHLIQEAVEESIYELTSETAVDLVGDAAKRKAAVEAKAREERLKFEAATEARAIEEKLFQKAVQERLERENLTVVEQRRSYINEKNSAVKASDSFMDTYIYAPIGFLFLGAITLGLLATGPVGWIIVGVIAWWIYHEDYSKPKNFLEEEASRLYPYKTTSEISSLVRAEAHRKNEASQKYISTYPFVSTDSTNPTNSRRPQQATPTSQSPSIVNSIDKDRFSKAIRDRVSDEINELAKRDPGLWFEAYQETKNLAKRNSLYQVIREKYIEKKMRTLLPTLPSAKWNQEIDKIPHMTSYEINVEIRDALRFTNYLK